MTSILEWNGPTFKNSLLRFIFHTGLIIKKKKILQLGNLTRMLGAICAQRQLVGEIQIYSHCKIKVNEYLYPHQIDQSVSGSSDHTFHIQASKTEPTTLPFAQIAGESGFVHQSRDVEFAGKHIHLNSMTVCLGSKNILHIISLQDGKVTNMQQKHTLKSAAIWLVSKKIWQLFSFAQQAKEVL